MMCRTLFDISRPAMSEVIDVNLVKKRFAKMLARVVAGEEIIISVNGKPYARMIPAVGAPTKGS